MIILIAGSFLLTNPKLNDRFLSIFSLEKEGNRTRIHIWQASLNMIKDKPLLGIGLGVFPSVYLDYTPPAADKDDIFAFAHNIFLQIAAEFGLIGLLLFLLAFALTYFLAYKLAKTGNPFYQGIFATLVGILIHQQVDLPIWKTNIGIGFWLLLGLVVGLYTLEISKNDCANAEPTVDGTSQCPRKLSKAFYVATCKQDSVTIYRFNMHYPKTMPKPDRVLNAKGVLKVGLKASVVIPYNSGSSSSLLRGAL